MIENLKHLASCQVESFHCLSTLSEAIGQEQARYAAQQWAASLSNKNRCKPLLFSGPPGTGKDEIARMTCNSLIDHGFSVFKLSASELTESVIPDGERKAMPSNLLVELFAFLATGQRCIIYVEEAHHLFPRSKSMSNAIGWPLRKTLGVLFDDNFQPGSSVHLKDDIFLTWFPNVQGFIFTTKNPEKMDNDLRNQRLAEVPLSPRYSETEMAGLVNLFLSARGFRAASEKVATGMASAARFNPRMLRNLVDKLALSAGDKRTVNKDDAIAAMRAASIYPRGLTHSEIVLLATISEKGKICSRVGLASAMNHEEGKLRSSFRFLFELELVNESRQKWAITEKGSQYLTGLGKAGFSI